MTKVLSSSEFQSQVLNSDKPVLVDFFATWCGPCKRVAPVVDEIAQEVAGKVDVYKIDIDQSPDIASKFGVMSVPTFIVFEKGEVKKQALGAQPKAQIMGLIS